MFLHIGNGSSLPLKDIIGIFDLDTATVSKQTRVVIKQAEQEKRLSYTDEDLPRSFLLCADNTLHLSRISSVGLRLRIKELTEQFGTAEEEE